MVQPFKQTKGRQLILNILKKAKSPLSTKEIVDKANNKIDQATVYRALNTFETNNIIFSDVVADEKLYYISDNKHHHIICQSCHKIKCIPCSHSLLKVSGFKNIKHNMYLIGTCNNCN